MKISMAISKKSLGRIKKHNPNRESAHSSHTAQWGRVNSEVDFLNLFKLIFLMRYFGDPIFQQCLHNRSACNLVHKLVFLGRKHRCIKIRPPLYKEFTPLLLKVNLRNFKSRQKVDLSIEKVYHINRSKMIKNLVKLIELGS